MQDGWHRQVLSFMKTRQILRISRLGVGIFKES